MRTRTLLLPLIGAALLAGCTAGGGASSRSSAAPPSSAASPSPSASARALDGRTFVSTGVTGRQLVTGTRITLTFREGRLSVEAGCNSMSGFYTLGADGRLSLAEMLSTMMACEDGRMAQDEWLAKFLPGAEVALSGDALTLVNAGVSVTLVDRQTTNMPLEGTTWRLDGLITADAVSSVPTGVAATLRFHDGTVEVNTGCNIGGGPAAITGRTVTFAAMALSKRACTTWAGAVEVQIMAVLTGEQPYSIAGDSLTIGAPGRNGLMLRGAADVSATPSPGPS